MVNYLEVFTQGQLKAKYKDNRKWKDFLHSDIFNVVNVYESVQRTLYIALRVGFLMKSVILNKFGRAKFVGQ